MYYARFQVFTPVSSKSSLFWVVAHHSLACHWLFGTAYWSHLQGSRCLLVTNQPTVRKNPEQQRSQGAGKFQFNVLQLILALYSPYLQESAGNIFLQLSDKRHIQLTRWSLDVKVLLCPEWFFWDRLHCEDCYYTCPQVKLHGFRSH
jgi:hypothetical protein